MKVFTIHERRPAGGIDPDPILVKEGFCWPAFFFGILWALSSGLWLAALLMAGVAAALILAFNILGIDPLTAMAAWFAFALLIGFEANDWRRARLARRGWGFAGVIAADGRDAAIRRWFDLNPAATAPSAPPWPAF